MKTQWKGKKQLKRVKCRNTLKTSDVTLCQFYNKLIFNFLCWFLKDNYRLTSFFSHNHISYITKHFLFFIYLPFYHSISLLSTKYIFFNVTLKCRMKSLPHGWLMYHYSFLKSCCVVKSASLSSFASITPPYLCSLHHP